MTEDGFKTTLETQMRLIPNVKNIGLIDDEFKIMCNSMGNDSFLCIKQSDTTILNTNDIYIFNDIFEWDYKKTIDLVLLN